MAEAAPPRGFPVAEHEARAARAQALMAEAGLSGLLLMSEPEVRYFSGFLTPFWQSPTRPWFLFIPASGKPVAVIPEIGAALMRETWLDDVRTWNAPEPRDDGVSLLIDLLGPLARRGAAVGLLKGHETALRMPLGDFERLTAALPSLGWADATPLVRRLRTVKSPAEIAKIAHVCAAASRAFDHARVLFFEGQPLAEAFRAFRIELLRQGADEVPYLVGGAGPGGYKDVIAPPSTRPLRTGDVLMLDTGAVFDGYFCDFDRNFAVGRADDATRRAYATLYRATEAGIAAARPGAACREVFQAMQDVLGKQDGGVGRLGHGLGTTLTEWPSLAAWDDTVLEAGMAITLEPSIGYGDGRIMVHEENLVVQNGPPRLLTKRAPLELAVIG